MIERLLRMFGREPGERERKALEVAVQQVKSDATVERIDRALRRRDEVGEMIRADYKRQDDRLAGRR